MSDLWVICAEQTFSATGSPTFPAISAASLAESARPPGTTGTPASASSRGAPNSDNGASDQTGPPGRGRGRRQDGRTIRSRSHPPPVLQPAQHEAHRPHSQVQPAEDADAVLAQQLPAVT